MEVILLERVEKLGAIGDIVNVKPGFARNYLLPRKKALRANEANKKLFEAQRAQIEADNAKRKEGAVAVLIRQAGDSGQLYGSVSSRDIAEALTDAGKAVSKSQVVLDKPIKTLGVHAVKVVLHPEVVVGVKANVARSTEEAALQERGVNVVQQQAEEEAAEAAAQAAEAAAAREEAMGDE
jgi:large subunit ribosomal protein L9